MLSGYSHSRNLKSQEIHMSNVCTVACLLLKFLLKKVLKSLRISGWMDGWMVEETDGRMDG